MITEKHVHDNPVLIKALSGLPAKVFWQLIGDLKAKMPEYERQRHERPDRQRAVGAGRPCDQPLVIRVMLVLTYLRLHIPQETVALLFGATQPDVSRELRRLLPLIVLVLPVPEVWKIMDEAEESLTEEQVLELVQLTDGRALVDATEQEVYRPQPVLGAGTGDNETRKRYYSGKQKAFTLPGQDRQDRACHRWRAPYCGHQ